MIRYVETKKQYDDLAPGLLEYCQNVRRIQFDTETTGLDPWSSDLLLMQFGGKFDQAVFNIRSLKAQGEREFKALKQILAEDNVVKILHNAKFDYKVVLHHLGVRMSNIQDTMIAAHLLNAGNNKGGADLASLLKEHGIAELDKDVRQTFPNYKGYRFSKEQIEYSAIDVMYLEKLHNVLFQGLARYGLEPVYDLERFCIPGTAEMEYNGMYLDYAKWAKLEAKAKKEIGKSKEALDEFFIPVVGTNLFGEANINYASPVQLKPALEKILGKELESTSETYLEEEKGHPAIDALFLYREYLKKISTYGTEFYSKNINSITRRIHSSFNQTGSTDTGRYSSSRPKNKLGHIV